MKCTGTTLGQSYADFLPLWEPLLSEEAYDATTPSQAPIGNDGEGEPPCLVTAGICDDDKCNDDCQKDYGQDGGCMVVPDRNICCCGM